MNEHLNIYIPPELEMRHILDDMQSILRKLDGFDKPPVRNYTVYMQIVDTKIKLRSAIEHFKRACNSWMREIHASIDAELERGSPVYLTCIHCKKRFDEAKVEIFDISEDMTGRDRVVFYCPDCKKDSESLRIG